MRYTEGFLNRETCLAAGHIRHLQLKLEEQICLLCCVSMQSLECDALQRKLEVWLAQEAAQVLVRSDIVEIKKELERLRACLSREGKPCRLYLIWRGHLYFVDEGKNMAEEDLERSEDDFFYACHGKRGILAETVQGEFDWERRWQDLKKYSLEERANRLQAALLDAMSKGILEGGYFISWEDEDDFQTGR